MSINTTTKCSVSKYFLFKIFNPWGEATKCSVSKYFLFKIFNHSVISGPRSALKMGARKSKICHRFDFIFQPSQPIKFEFVFMEGKLYVV